MKYIQVMHFKHSHYLSVLHTAFCSKKTEHQRVFDSKIGGLKVLRDPKFKCTRTCEKGMDLTPIRGEIVY